MTQDFKHLKRVIGPDGKSANLSVMDYANAFATIATAEFR